MNRVWVWRAERLGIGYAGGGFSLCGRCISIVDKESSRKWYDVQEAGIGAWKRTNFCDAASSKCVNLGNLVLGVRCGGSADEDGETKNKGEDVEKTRHAVVN